MELRKDTFALFLSGQYNTATRKAYEGVVKGGSCASYVSFHNMTHFGMNDFVGPSEETHQVRPECTHCKAHGTCPCQAAGRTNCAKAPAAALLHAMQLCTAQKAFF